MPKYEEVNWDKAECRDMWTELFYVVEEERNVVAYDNINALRSVCARCPIGKDCLTYGFENEIYGVWGGLTSVERRSITNPVKYPQQRRRAVESMATFGVSFQQIKDCV